MNSDCVCVCVCVYVLGYIVRLAVFSIEGHNICFKGILFCAALKIW